uniref:(California timema) hypothetical protein n=1 Tax=Timema californicum TaxID=61474 RepID=A0A7R9J6L7_TIMCA|nr:unnamed protein product [Timema californicum]
MLTSIWNEVSRLSRGGAPLRPDLRLMSHSASLSSCECESENREGGMASLQDDIIVLELNKDVSGSEPDSSDNNDIDIECNNDNEDLELFDKSVLKQRIVNSPRPILCLKETSSWLAATCPPGVSPSESLPRVSYSEIGRCRVKIFLTSESVLPRLSDSETVVESVLAAVQSVLKLLESAPRACCCLRPWQISIAGPLPAESVLKLLESLLRAFCCPPTLTAKYCWSLTCRLYLEAAGVCTESLLLSPILTDKYCWSLTCRVCLEAAGVCTESLQLSPNPDSQNVKPVVQALGSRWLKQKGLCVRLIAGLSLDNGGTGRGEVQDAVNPFCGLYVVGHQCPFICALALTVLDDEVQDGTAAITPSIQPYGDYCRVDREKLGLFGLHRNCAVREHDQHYSQVLTSSLTVKHLQRPYENHSRFMIREIMSIHCRLPVAMCDLLTLFSPSLSVLAETGSEDGPASNCFIIGVLKLTFFLCGDLDSLTGVTQAQSVFRHNTKMI